MKNKKIGIALGVVLITLLIGFFVYEYTIKTDNSTTLTLAEKQWIESNKNKVFDFSITNNIPVFNYNGEGVFFDFLTALEKDTGLEFNKVPFPYGSENKAGYGFQIKKDLEKKDILLYEDTYALVLGKKVKYSRLEELNGLTIGVTNDDLEKVNAYLKGANVTYKTYETRADLLETMKEVGKEGSEIHGIVVPGLVYFKEIVSNDSFQIAFQLNGLAEKYVISLGDNDRLNTILTKYYKKWSSEQFENAFNKYFADDYFEFINVEEKKKVDFRSKRYNYGFVENRPYDAIVKNKLYGINSNILREFSRLSDIEISYIEYENMDLLVRALNENKIDFFFGMNSNTKYDTDVTSTVSFTNEDVVLICDMKQNKLVSSLSSLRGEEVFVLKGTKISKSLTENGIKVKEFDTIRLMLSAKKADSILALDRHTYEYYMRSELERFIPIYEYTLSDSYGYVIRNIEANQVFADFLNFYLSFTNENTFVHRAYEDLLVFRSGNNIFVTIFLTIIALIILLFAVFGLYKYIHVEKKQASLTKGDRIRYIDQLTSLKNRNYLNDNIETWDDSEVYPQSIVVVDLNNIAYINDNYGYQEGDSVIKEAANVLIKTQIENSDIIRTNGNEFLIYLVGYDEKQIVAYTRKLTKELKEIAHGFGAAVGYSMITDAIKTIDDAVNEATLDMRAIKEESNSN